ncbi:PrsW family intramembrane metalloprotease [Candidatus Micrarchaeota archaeon]|nr:PrsW family intramembrane metalloprotease [Candidatus Micrarchaeota archaeon]
MKVIKIIMLIIVFSLILHSYTIPLTKVKTTLLCNIKVSDTNFDNKEGLITIEADVTNSQDTPKILYIGEVKDEKIDVIKPIGPIDANTKIHTRINIQTSYNKKTYNTRQFVIFMNEDDDGKHPTKFFMIKEDWSKYEKGVAEWIIRSNIVTVPIIAIIFILFIILVSQTLSVKPFNVETFFFPRARDIYEEFATLLINPFTWIVELIIIIIMGIVTNYYYGNAGNALWPQIFILSILGALLFPVIYLAIAWYSEKTKEFKPLKFFFGLFLFGGVAAYIAFGLNTSVIGLIKGHNVDENSVLYLLLTAALIAPMIEEITKSLGLFIISLHHIFDNSITGLLFGFTIGIGFSFIENLFYFASRADPFTLGFFPWVQLIVYRSIFNSLAHGIVTGVGGSIIGHVKSLTNDRKMLIIAWIVSLMLSIPLHIMFNVSAIIDGSTVNGGEIFGLPVMFNPITVIFLLIIFVIIYTVTYHEKNMRI